MRLLRSVRDNGVAWRAEDVDLAAVVSAEVFDYYALYDDAKEALKGNDSDEEVLDDLSQSAKDEALTKRPWLALAFAQTHHRDEQYRDARHVLQTCSAALDARDADKIRHLGTRARLQFGTIRVIRPV